LVPQNKSTKCGLSDAVNKIASQYTNSIPNNSNDNPIKEAMSTTGFAALAVIPTLTDTNLVRYSFFDASTA